MRLFTAIELDERAKDGLIRLQESLGRYGRVVRWVTREQMHLTLVFLGEVPDGRVSQVAEAVQRAAGRIEPFDLTIAGSGCFPPRGRVRVVWVGVEERSGWLLRCQSACADELESVGFPKESRPYSPHLTLGRVRDDTTNGALRNDVDRLQVERAAQHVESVRLIQSVLTPHGARYSTVAQCPLKS